MDDEEKAALLSMLEKLFNLSTQTALKVTAAQRILQRHAPHYNHDPYQVIAVWTHFVSVLNGGQRGLYDRWAYHYRYQFGRNVLQSS